jgi:hypothetical protein
MIIGEVFSSDKRNGDHFAIWDTGAYIGLMVKIYHRGINQDKRSRQTFKTNVQDKRSRQTLYQSKWRP